MIPHDFEQRSHEWYLVRSGIPTASEFGKLLTEKTLKPPKSDDYAYQLACEHLVKGPVDSWNGNEATEHGIEAEQDALEAYHAATGYETSGIGFVTNDDKTAGCSPDKFVGEEGLLEIKSLYAKNFMKAYNEAKRSGECPTEYRLQVQGQLMICERKWCDLFFFHPLLPPKIIRVKPDLEIHEKLKAAIAAIIIKRDEELSFFMED